MWNKIKKIEGIILKSCGEIIEDLQICGDNLEEFEVKILKTKKFKEIIIYGGLLR